MDTSGDQVALTRYLPHSIVATVVVAVAPLWFALWLTDGSAIPALVVSFALALVLSNLGTALWKRTSSSYDLVFDDLMLWGFLRRLRAQRQAPKSLERIKLAIANEAQNSTSPEDRLRLLKQLAAALETGDPYTNGHSGRVAHHAFMTARALRLPRKQRNKIRLAAVLHDVGKMFIAKEVLNKPGKLSDEEFEIIKTHPMLGAELLERVGDDELTAMVRHHHERMDGTGYPDRLMGQEIPIGARVISVADTFDAITSRRPYRPAQKHRLALEILEREAGTQLDADVVAAFLTYYSGRRSLGKWLFFTTSFRQTLEFSLVAVQRAGLAAANAAVVGGATVAIAASGAVHSDVPKQPHPRNEKAVVRADDSHKDKKARSSVASTTSSSTTSVVTSQGSSTSSTNRTATDSRRTLSDSTTNKVDSPGESVKATNNANETSAVATGDTGASEARGNAPEKADPAGLVDSAVAGSKKPKSPPGDAQSDEPTASDLEDLIPNEGSEGKGKNR